MKSICTIFCIPFLNASFNRFEGLRKGRFKERNSYLDLSCVEDRRAAVPLPFETPNMVLVRWAPGEIPA